jgi:hypothetical protein
LEKTTFLFSLSLSGEEEPVVTWTTPFTSGHTGQRRKENELEQGEDSMQIFNKHMVIFTVIIQYPRRSH